MQATKLATKNGVSVRGLRHFVLVLTLLLSPSLQAETVKYLDNGQLALSAMYNAIKNAKTSIDMAYYEVHQCDSVFKVIVQAIKNRSLELRKLGKPILKVRFLADYHPFVNMQQAQLFREYLRVNGIESRLFNTTGLQNRNHSKFMIIDQNILITGGRNLGDAYFALKAGAVNYVDRDVFIEGKAAQEATGSFSKLWRGNDAHALDRADIQDFRETRASCFAFGARERRITAYLEQFAIGALAAAPPFQCNEVQFVTDTRVRAPKKPTALKIGNLLRQARSSIHIENYSYLPHDNIDEILRNKRRSVQVQVFTNHFAQRQRQSDHDHLHRFYLARDNNNRQTNYPISISPKNSQNWQFTPRGAHYAIHSKVYVVDTNSIAVTSSNIDPRSISYKRNLESGVTIKNCPQLAYHAEMKSLELFREIPHHEQMNMRGRLVQYERDERFSLSLRSLLQSAIEDML